jgi:excisionase family DNA binding protein
MTSPTNRRRSRSATRRKLSRRLYPNDPESRRIWLEQTWLRPGEVAALLQVSRRSIAAWARDGKIPFIETPGGHRRFRAIDVRRLVDALKVAGPAAG